MNEVVAGGGESTFSQLISTQLNSALYTTFELILIHHAIFLFLIIIIVMTVHRVKLTDQSNST